MELNVQRAYEQLERNAREAVDQIILRLSGAEADRDDLRLAKVGSRCESLSELSAAGGFRFGRVLVERHSPARIEFLISMWTKAIVRAEDEAPSDMPPSDVIERWGAPATQPILDLADELGLLADRDILDEQLSLSYKFAVAMLAGLEQRYSEL